jgi:hypothetical protein
MQVEFCGCCGRPLVDRCPEVSSVIAGYVGAHDVERDVLGFLGYVACVVQPFGEHCDAEINGKRHAAVEDASGREPLVGPLAVTHGINDQPRLVSCSLLPHVKRANVAVEEDIVPSCPEHGRRFHVLDVRRDFVPPRVERRLVLEHLGLEILSVATAHSALNDSM